MNRPQLSLEMGFRGRGEMQQQMTITPPIANTLEEAVAEAPRKKSTNIREAELNAIRDYLTTENPNKPYSDKKVLAYMKEQGYQVNQGQLLLARSILDLEAD